MDQRWMLQSLLDELGVALDAMSPLSAYGRYVQDSADRLGLVSAIGLNDFMERHIAESLAFAQVRRPSPNETWCDVGSGAGLPGLVLGISFPETRWVLVEAQQRRAAFLELTVDDLGLANVVVEPRRAQSLTLDADVVVSRAFSSKEGSGADSRALSLFSSLTRPGGEIIVQIARKADIPQTCRRVRTPLPGVDSSVDFLIMRA